MNYVIYDIYNGIIQRNFQGPTNTVLGQLAENESVILSEGLVSQEDWHVDLQSGLLTPNNDFDLKNLPLPCNITIEGVTYQCTEQPDFEFDAPGKYTIAVDAGPKYLKKEFTLDYQP